MGQTLTEKILSRAAGRPVKAGETVYPEPDLMTVHDWYVVNFDKALKELGVTALYDPKRVLISTDHEPVALSPQSAERQKAVREIVKKYGIERFFDAGRGGHGHVFPMEMGFVRPGMFVLAYDTHVTNYGAVGALGIAVVFEIPEVLACGSVWIRVPETVRVNLTGALKPGMAIRDVSQRMIVDIGEDNLDYAVVEYGGPALKDVNFAGRMTLCNSPLEMGAKSALVEVDEVTKAWLAPRLKGPIAAEKSDPDATFKAVYDYDLGLMEPQVAAPPRPDNVVGVSSVAGVRVNHAFIGSCANGSIEDMRDAARILRGRKIHPEVRLFITPATQEIAQRAGQEGLLNIFLESGAVMTAPGCGPCAGGRIAPIAPGEVSINTGTRNDPGRLGTTKADVYLASPFTVAASAVAGEISDPRKYL
ncbi:MAG TPA: aconitase/3-isopropylmalate dehydratase large subunit family protein [Alphaproteobacteria bacterium]|nr:aconitase/3-isopropylmalate dehydratase large subunit family protein [Alphaproteobacteria bacterium]